MSTFFFLLLIDSWEKRTRFEIPNETRKVEPAVRIELQPADYEFRHEYTWKELIMQYFCIVFHSRSLKKTSKTFEKAIN